MQWQCYEMEYWNRMVYINECNECPSKVYERREIACGIKGNLELCVEAKVGKEPRPKKAITLCGIKFKHSRSISCKNCKFLKANAHSSTSRPQQLDLIAVNGQMRLRWPDDGSDDTMMAQMVKWWLRWSDDGSYGHLMGHMVRWWFRWSGDCSDGQVVAQMVWKWLIYKQLQLKLNIDYFTL